jgi:phosphoribosylaminoimidazole-succinocarboxamide synthase
MGSVKDLIILEEPTETQMGRGVFEFSDRYSIFDWGEMPDHVPYAGASRCMTSAYFFENLGVKGVPTHYRGLNDDSGRKYLTAGVPGPMTQMEIDLVRVVKPVPVTTLDGKTTWYNYSFFRQARNKGEGNFVVPLEFIYRNTLPTGSSVFRRLEEGTLSLKTMDLAEMPKEGEALPQMVVDVSAKFERHDRYPDERNGESRRTFFSGLGGLSDDEVEEMRYMLEEANGVITEGLSHAGLQNDDGKLEFAFTPERQLMIVDAMGTLDECRFTYPFEGGRVEVCKEMPRQYYKCEQPDWVAEIDKAKKSGEKDWRSLVRSRPRNLPPQLLEILSHAYASFANAVLERQIFNVPSLHEVAREYQRFKKLEMK